MNGPDVGHCVSPVRSFSLIPVTDVLHDRQGLDGLRPTQSGRCQIRDMFKVGAGQALGQGSPRMGCAAPREIEPRA